MSKKKVKKQRKLRKKETNQKIKNSRDIRSNYVYTKKGFIPFLKKQ